jgi:two-component system, LytTR family, sensor kinase
MAETQPRWKIPLLIITIWASVWMVLTAQLYFTMLPFGMGVSLREVAFSQFLRVALWALFTPLVLQTLRWLPFDGRHDWRNFSIHFLLSVVAMLTNYSMRMGAAEFYGDSERGTLDFFNYAVLYFNGRNFVDILIYWAIIGGRTGWELLKSKHDLELARAELQTQLAAAELHALKQQLQPHFLFNALNSVAMLVREKQEERAVDTLALISSLLRRLIDSTRQQEVPFATELDFTQRYLEVERIRFGDRLQVDYSVEEACLRAIVPSLVLQPLVENAIKHGVSRRVAPGRIRIIARRGEGIMVLEVVNERGDTPGPAAATGSRIGLETTRARLQHVYGENFKLECDFNRPEGATVRISLPLRFVEILPATKGEFSS